MKKLILLSVIIIGFTFNSYTQESKTHIFELNHIIDNGQIIPSEKHTIISVTVYSDSVTTEINGEITSEVIVDVTMYEKSVVYTLSNPLIGLVLLTIFDNEASIKFEIDPNIVYVYKIIQ